MDVPLHQLVNRSPLPSAGTRPEATAPTTAPMKNGVSSDEMANDAPSTRCTASRPATWRRAKLAPRRTMPSAASESGTNSVVPIAEKASGNPVHSTTRMKMSHTWLASHTGVMARSIRARGRAPRSASPATRSQKPAPKSAPPRIA